MDEFKHAYETLGLPEDAEREQVEQRYLLLLKKNRSIPSDLAEITRAYNKIIAYESEKASPAEKQSKTAYFFYYYKFHVIAAVLLLLVAIFTIKGIVDRKIEEANKPPLDLSVTVFGNFFSSDGQDDQLSRNLLALFPQWKRIDVLVSYIPDELKSQQDMALQQKGMLTMMTEKMDLMIVDDKNFEMLAKQKAFVSLDSLSVWPELQKNPGRIRNALAEEETQSKPYGVDITGSKVFAGTQIDQQGEHKIVAMRAEPKHPDKALQMLRLLTAAP